MLGVINQPSHDINAMAAAKSNTTTVFISHAGPDSDFATWIADGLRKVGVTARLDQLEIKAGDNVVTWMNDAIGESDYLLVLLSPKSVKRYWVEMEWSNALMKEAHLRRTFVLPALLPELEDSQIPDMLRAKLFLDFRKTPDKAFLQLVSRLKEDKLTQRELGRCPSPAPRNMVEAVEKRFGDTTDTIEVISIPTGLGAVCVFACRPKPRLLI